MYLETVYGVTIMKALRFAIEIIGQGDSPDDIDEWTTIDGFDLNVWSNDGWMYGNLYEVDEKGNTVTDRWIRIFDIKKTEN